jgi:hypothetical protein
MQKRFDARQPFSLQVFQKVGPQNGEKQAGSWVSLAIGTATPAGVLRRLRSFNRRRVSRWRVRGLGRFFIGISFLDSLQRRVPAGAAREPVR